MTLCPLDEKGEKGFAGGLPGGVEVEVFALYAETRKAGVRKNSINALVGSAGRMSILTGDFNSVRGVDGSGFDF